MKVLHITGSDSNGAGIAALRIVLAQREFGVDAHLIVREKTTSYDFVHKFYYFKYFDYIINFFLRLFGLDNIISLNAFKIIRSRLFKAADVIHIHNIHHIRMLHPMLLPRNKKYAYTLHDMWAVTGNCNYTFDLCDKYLSGCGDCPLNKGKVDWGFPKMLIDQTSFHGKLKRRAYNRLNLIFISPSKWLMNIARQSVFTKNKVAICIPNCVQTKEKVYLKDYRSPLRLMFVGQKSRDNARKGFEHVLYAVNHLKIPHELHVVGMVSDDFQKKISNANCKVINHGPLSEDNMKSIYQIVHVLLLPSKQDNFPNSILESFLQGTPVVSFLTGGIPELVNDKTGYLAKFQDSEDFTRGIEVVWDSIEVLSNNVLSVIDQFSYQLSYAKHLEAYRLLDASQESDSSCCCK